MTRTLCLLGAGQHTATVIDAARDLANTLGTEVAVLHLVRHVGTPPPAGVAVPLRQQVTTDALAEAVTAAAATDVVCLVLGAEDRFPVGADDLPVITELATRVAVPMLVVPPSSVLGHTTHLRRVLVPHDGSARTSARLRGLIQRLRAAGVERVVLHVLDPHAGHGLLQEAAYDLDAWQREFRLRHLGEQDALAVRYGEPWERMRQEALKVGADAVVLAWGQQRSPARAAVIHAALDDRSLPLLLVPDQPRGIGSSASATGTDAAPS